MHDGLDELYIYKDERTEKTLQEMEFKRLQAYQNKDYEMLARIEKNIK